MVFMQNWRDLTYLKSGNERQQAAFNAINDLKIKSSLAAYDPVLVSTICLNIDTPKSDLDFIFFAKDLNEFSTAAQKLYGKFPKYTSDLKDINSEKCCVVTFESKGFEFEFFASNTPVENQAAYKHLVQTARIIALGGEPIRLQITKLKTENLKTEPAIAKLLGLFGDPYRAVTKLSEISDEELEGLCRLALKRVRPIDF